jgi:hypothetical protein
VGSELNPSANGRPERDVTAEVVVVLEGDVVEVVLVEVDEVVVVEDRRPSATPEVRRTGRPGAGCVAAVVLVVLVDVVLAATSGTAVPSVTAGIAAGTSGIVVGVDTDCAVSTAAAPSVIFREPRASVMARPTSTETMKIFHRSGSDRTLSRGRGIR